MHCFESLTCGGISGNFYCYGPRGRMNIWLFFVKIARRGVLTELEVCDLDKTWSACQKDEIMAVAVKKNQNF